MHSFVEKGVNMLAVCQPFGIARCWHSQSYRVPRYPLKCLRDKAFLDQEPSQFLWQVSCSVVSVTEKDAKSRDERMLIMTTATPIQTEQYASTVAASKRVRWDIDRDVIRGRDFDMDQKFLPDSITGIQRLEFLDEQHARTLSQIQGRTYANTFGLVERFINAKVLELSQDHWTGDQIALESLVRFSDEELKHQELFRRIEQMIAAKMPPGYRYAAQPNEVANAVLSKSTWSVMGLTLLIELFTQAHYLESIKSDQECSPLYKDVFLYHWKEESQHARIDELEWVRVDAEMSPEQRDRAVDDMIDLVGAVDGIVRAQAEADVDYFLKISGAQFSAENIARLREGVLAAYRWQYILSGAGERRFQKVLRSLTTDAQLRRIEEAIAPLMGVADTIQTAA